MKKIITILLAVVMLATMATVRPSSSTAASCSLPSPAIM